MAVAGAEPLFYNNRFAIVLFVTLSFAIIWAVALATLL